MSADYQIFFGHLRQSTWQLTCHPQLLGREVPSRLFSSTLHSAVTKRLVSSLPLETLLGIISAHVNTAEGALFDEPALFLINYLTLFAPLSGTHLDSPNCSNSCRIDDKRHLALTCHLAYHGPQRHASAHSQGNTGVF